MSHRITKIAGLVLPGDIMDTANDLLAGLVGASVFVLVYKGTEWYQGKRAQPRRVGKRRT